MPFCSRLGGCFGIDNHQASAGTQIYETERLMGNTRHSSGRGNAGEPLQPGLSMTPAIESSSGSSSDDDEEEYDNYEYNGYEESEAYDHGGTFTYRGANSELPNHGFNNSDKDGENSSMFGRDSENLTLETTASGGLSDAVLISMANDHDDDGENCEPEESVIDFRPVGYNIRDPEVRYRLDNYFKVYRGTYMANQILRRHLRIDGYSRQGAPTASPLRNEIRISDI